MSDTAFHIPNRPSTWLIYALLMGLVSLLTFENILTQDFWDGADDRDMMTDLAVISRDFTHIVSQERRYDVRPPVDLIFLGGYLLWGETPAGYHKLHIALHVLASLLVAFTLHRLGIDLALSLFTGLFFSINVAHFRAVHWIICLGYVLALIFGLLFLLSHRQFLTHRKKRWMAGALCALGMSMLSHPSSASVVLFAVYLTWRQSASVKQTLISTWPMLITAPIFALIALLISPGGQSQGLLMAPEAARIPTNLFWYLGRLVTSAHWITRATSGNAQPLWELGIGVLALIGIGALYKKGIFPIADWAIWTLFGILPFLNNHPGRLAVGPSRQLYMASVGTSLILVWAMRHLIARQIPQNQKIRRAVFALALLLLTASSIVSLKRAEALSMYFTAISDKAHALPLFERAIARAPNLVPSDAYLRLVHSGLALGKTHRPILERALRKHPEDPQLNMLWGVTAYVQDDPDVQARGEARMRRAIARSDDPSQMRYDAAVALQNLAVFFNRRNELECAEQLYLKALDFYPDYPLALYSLGHIYGFQKENEKAIEAFRKVIALQPNHAAALRNLAKLLSLQGRLEEARRAFDKAAGRDLQSRAPNLQSP